MNKLSLTLIAAFGGLVGTVAPLSLAQLGEVDQKGNQAVTIPTDAPGQHSSSAERLRIEPPAVIAETSDTNDHLAKIFQFQGDVRILKRNSEEWKPVEKGMIVGVGDQILTGKDSHLDISYDNYYLNVARIEQNTKAEFLNIEPTIVRLEDGSIFNSLDGLHKDESYQIATPTAVAAVRGTRFPVSFEAETGILKVAVLDEKDAAVEHKIELTQILSDGSEGAKLEVGEGLQFDLGSDPENFSQELIKPMEVDFHARYETIVFNDLMSGINPKDRDSGFERLEDDERKGVHDGNPPGGGRGPDSSLDDFDSTLDRLLLHEEGNQDSDEDAFLHEKGVDRPEPMDRREPGSQDWMGQRPMPPHDPTLPPPMVPPQPPPDDTRQDNFPSGYGSTSPPPCEPPNCY